MLRGELKQKLEQLNGNTPAIHAEREKLRRRLVNMSQSDQRPAQTSFNLSFDQITYPTSLGDMHAFVN